jgi:hypothetical protein
MKAQSIVLFGSLFVLAACGGTSYKATLTGGAEVPTVASSATGSVTLTLDGTTADITGNYAGLSGAAQAAHIHGPSDAASTAPVLCALTFTESATAGTGTLAGECPTFDVTNLNAGKLYVNVHTVAHGGGEIRGQLAKQ